MYILACTLTPWGHWPYELPMRWADRIVVAEAIFIFLEACSCYVYSIFWPCSYPIIAFPLLHAHSHFSLNILYFLALPFICSLHPLASFSSFILLTSLAIFIRTLYILQWFYRNYMFTTFIVDMLFLYYLYNSRSYHNVVPK